MLLDVHTTTHLQNKFKNESVVILLALNKGFEKRPQTKLYFSNQGKSFSPINYNHCTIW